MARPTLHIEPAAREVLLRLQARYPDRVIRIRHDGFG